MDRSRSLYKLQKLDSTIDDARKRIEEIDLALQDDQDLQQAARRHQDLLAVSQERNQALNKAETQVEDQNFKIEQNQKKLYGGAITNPKELEDLQLEATSLSNYLQVLEDRQLEAMIAAENAQAELDTASQHLDQVRSRLEREHEDLLLEKENLLDTIDSASQQREDYLDSTDLPDLPSYNSLRKSLGGIAVTLMRSSSCLSCGASIPSAIEQAARSPGKLANCPTCKRILHPG